MVREFGLPDLPQEVFLNSAEKVLAHGGSEHSHHMRRAFRELGIDAILVIGGVPTVYFKRVPGRLDRITAGQIQKKVWNQATASVLVLRDEHTVYVFAAQGCPDSAGGALAGHPCFVDSLDWAADVLEDVRFVERIATGAFYREYPGKFRPTTSVDHYLIGNLKALCDRLIQGKPDDSRSAINAFVGRLVFLCYLIDRLIIRLGDYPGVPRDVSKLPALFVRLQGDSERLHAVFFGLLDAVRQDFNGSMFDDTIDRERELITVADMQTLGWFLNADDLRCHQPTLPFCMYDFSVIPVETISAIYEQLLGWADLAEKTATGSFYTPRHLAEMTVSEVTAGLETLLDKSFLDPSCGSGIFLVTLFNRMAEEWRRRNLSLAEDNDVKASVLKRLLLDNVCGIDVKDTACQIACFSLYVALLDQFDPPYLAALQNRQQRFLPKLLGRQHDDGSFPAGASVLWGDFFRTPTHWERASFDVVVGNPPWVGRLAKDKEVVSSALAWARDPVRNAWREACGIPVLRRKSERRRLTKSVFLPNNQVAHTFMWKAPLHVKPGGRCCLLLPSSVLLNNQTQEFQARWLRQNTLERVVQFADYRRILFEGAISPCVMVRFREGHPKTDRHVFEHIAPRFIRADTRCGRIPVRPNDRESVFLGDVLAAVENGRPTAFWKQLQRSSLRERRFLRFLEGCPTILDSIGKAGGKAGWLKGVGFQPDYRVKHYPNPKPVPWSLDETLYVSAETMPKSPVLLRRDCVTLRQGLSGMTTCVSGKRWPASLLTLRRAPDERLFQPPLLVFNQGFTKFSFVSFPVVFRDSLRSISVRDEDAFLVAFLAACLGSPLAPFMQFHTASTLATERQRVNLDDEFLSFPFPLPGWRHVAEDAREIAARAATEVQSLEEELEARYAREQTGGLELSAESADGYRTRRVGELRARLNQLVYDYFGLTDEEIALVEDTWHVYLPSATPESYSKDIPTLRPTSPEQRLVYARWLCRALNRWAREAQPAGREPPFFFTAETSRLDVVGQVLVTLSKGSVETEPLECEMVDAGLVEAVGRLAALDLRRHGPFDYLYGTVVVDKSYIRILKPDLLGEWTRTAALNDAAEIYQAIVTSSEDKG